MVQVNLEMIISLVYYISIICSFYTIGFEKTISTVFSILFITLFISLVILEFNWKRRFKYILIICSVLFELSLYLCTLVITVYIMVLF
jgi:hypothetical protein